MSLIAIRFFLWVSVAAAGVGLLWWCADKIGDAREAQVRAAYDQAIDNANSDTVASNDAATKVQLRDQRVRDQAVTAYKASLGNACPLTADEATNLSRIR